MMYLFSFLCIFSTAIKSFGADLGIVHYNIGDNFEKELAYSKISLVEIENFNVEKEDYSGPSYIRIRSQAAQGPQGISAEVECKISEEVAKTALNFSLKELFVLLNQSLLSESKNNKLLIKCYNGKIDNILNNKYRQVLSVWAQRIVIKTQAEVYDFNNKSYNMRIDYELVNKLAK